MYIIVYLLYIKYENQILAGYLPLYHLQKTKLFLTKSDIIA
jgi:hypothetical protein